MGLGDIHNCLSEVAQLLDARGLSSGSMMHSVQQIMGGVEAALQGKWVTFEERLRISITDQGGQTRDAVTRQYDRIERSLTSFQDVEVKTSADLRNALDFTKNEVSGLKADVIAAMARPQSRDLTGLTFDPETLAGMTTRLNTLVRQMVEEGFSPSAIQMALSNLQFVDKAGRAITAEFNEKGEVIFAEAMQVASVKLGEAATDGMSNSPDFAPAMQIAFGTNGKLADAAKDAAGAANFDPALDSFENKIEEGVGEALEEAGQAAADTAGASLGSSISAGANALGNVLTSIPQMHQSVVALGEAWDKPLNSTEDYMNLFSALGGTITQGVQTFEALAGITEIASAAQAIFNAIMAMNPIVLIVIAVIVLIGLIALLIIYWDEVSAAVRDNPWIAAIGLIFGPIGILIGLIVLIAAHWEEVKLAVLIAANFISIQVQKIAAFFVGLYTVAGQVWDIIVATAVNAGIGIANAFISVGTEIQNFFIGVVNGILEMYNAVATSAIGEFVGLEPAELIPEVDVETRLIPPREVPELDVDAAFNTGSITGGLEDMIAEQETAVAAARAEDEARRAADAAAEAAPPAAAPGAPGAAPGLPGLPTGLPSAPPALPAGAALPRPALPEGAAAAAGGGGAVDASVNVGSISISITADRLEADAADFLTEDIIQQLQARLGALRSEQDFRTGVR